MKAVKIENLSVYYGQTKALENVSMEVEEGEFLGIMGPNGGGKSTLLKAVLGLIPTTTGRILVYNKDIKENRSIIGYVPQFATMDKRFPISVFEVVLTGCIRKKISLFHKYSSKDRELAYEQLNRVGIAKLANRQISELSGGEFQKLLIARALAVQPKLLLLDEPTASVDAKSRDQIYELLGELNKEMTIILVTHDMMAISSNVRSLACLNGDLTYHGELELNENIVNKLYGCPVDLIAHGVPHRVLKQHRR
ncbi:metal ABC transporter ATP-binding protein [Anaerosacchariphilus polymeriproducens]|uniref:ABC transporter ATP-binding protein n=1 Tax=Anaerosacchariphilus polymeriproducens TaxID=1812858 RepID=A0A371AVA1_9FIRM|nr:ABC transporter ATP-binding protein [Anaerosacchariphilus polymeriproducens]RDU23503.1 ABC transporter ATP-binding protein [Anaerosacchariphilus polymeriproducens]